MSSFIKSTNTYISDWSSPEQRLFIAVLSQAIHDAFSKHIPTFEKERARTWLMGNSKDFRDICELSGRNHRYVFEKIRKKILRANGWNVDISMRVSSPRRRNQMKRINKNHLTGNSYYAAKKEQRTIS